jgi:hypothetical protein
MKSARTASHAYRNPQPTIYGETTVHSQPALSHPTHRRTHSSLHLKQNKQQAFKKVIGSKTVKPVKCKFSLK